MMTEQLFQLGQIVATPASLAVIEAAGAKPEDIVRRHGAGDWGDLCTEDQELNDLAVQNGDRILSAYKTTDGKVWIITEAADDNGNRLATTILLPEEY